MIITPKEEEPIIEETPKKKRHFGWLVFLIIVVILIGAPIGLAYGFLYDNSPCEFQPSEGFDKQKTIDKLYADPFDDTKDTALIHYDVPLLDVNNVIYETLQNTLGSNFFGAVAGAYIKSDENSYYLVLKTAGNPIFETKATLVLSLSRTQQEDLDYLYSFSIDKLIVGRAEFLDNAIVSYLSTYIEDAKIEQEFAKVGFTVKSNIQERKITALESTLIEDVKNLIKDRSDLFYLRMIESFLNLKLIDLTHDNDSLLVMDIDLSKLGTNVYHDATKAKNIDIPALTSKMKTLLNNSIIELDDTESMLTYLLDGYDDVSDEIKSKVSALDLSSIEIPDVTTYLGVKQKENIDPEEYFHDQVDLPTIIATGNIGSINENVFTSVFRDKEIVGHSYEFKRKDDYHYNVMMIDDIYVNILDNKLIFSLSLNVNGYVTELVVKTSQFDTGNDYQLGLTVDSIKYGDKNIVSGFEEEIMKIMSNKMTLDMFTITNEGKIYIDFEQFFDASAKAAVEARGGLSIELVGDELTSIGELSVKTKN